MCAARAARAARPSAGFVLFRRFHCELQYLLLRASKRSQHWSPPKGHVDPGEDFFSTALRETKEETGLLEEDMIIFKEHMQEIHYLVKGKDKKVVYWLAELKNPNTEVTLSEEHLDMKWATYQEATTLANYPEFVEMLQKYEGIIKTCL